MHEVNCSQNTHVPSLQESYKNIVRWIGWLVITIAALVVLSWFFDIEAGKRILPAFQSMKFNTALCFLACGLIFQRISIPGKAMSRDSIVASLAFLIVLISGVTLLEYGMGWQLGIDQILVKDLETPAQEWPGRMSAATALCFSMIGGGWLATMLTARYAALILQTLALMVIMISGAVLIGYAFGVHKFKLVVFSTMAVHTSLLLVLCGACMLFARPDESLMRSAASSYIGGRSLRRLAWGGCPEPRGRALPLNDRLIACCYDHDRRQWHYSNGQPARSLSVPLSSRPTIGPVSRATGSKRSPQGPCRVSP